MENRGQKRAEILEELPADKRACSSLKYKPSSSSSSNSPVQTHINSVTSTPVEAHGTDMESSSVSSQSDEEQDDEESPDEHSHRGDLGKIQRILPILIEDGDGSGQLIALTELCEVFSFSSDDSMSNSMLDSLSPVLVKLAKHQTNPDIMLYAIRALTYMCDVYSKAPGFLVRHDAVPALCQRLMAIEYLDVAEQCLLALDKISRDQPLACLQSGAIMASLTFIDFFSTTIQRVALSIVVNICKELPSEYPSPVMEAVPILCNILQYEDRQLVEKVATCLIKIVDKVGQSSERMDELCKHGLLHQVTHLIELNSRTTISQPIHTGLIGMLVKLASGSFTAVKNLFELNISSIMKNILSSYELSHRMPSQHMAAGHCDQVREVLKLLNELLPPIVRGDQDVQPASDKESFVINHPHLLQKFGMDILPKLVQVVDSGTNLRVFYGCMSIINKLVYFSKADMLLELLKNINISSFLTGILTRKDHHIVLLALEIVDTVLQKLPDYFLNSFIKEGVFCSIDSLITPETQSVDPSQKSASKEVPVCLCYAFDLVHLASKRENCKIENGSVQNFAKRIWMNYFPTESHNLKKGLTDVYHKLNTFSASLIDLLNVPSNNEEILSHTIQQILEMLCGREPISNFEFIKSGVINSLVKYLSNGTHVRFEAISRQLLSLSETISQDLPLLIITRKLLNALSSIENFPVVMSHVSNGRNSYCTIPYKRCTAYPSLRVKFVRGEGETSLCDFCEDIATVDPLSSVESIDEFLWPKVCNKTKTESDTISSALREMQVDRGNMSHSEHQEVVDARQSTLEEKHKVEISNVSVKKEIQCSPTADTAGTQPSVSSSTKKDSRKLSFYFEGKQVDRALTLYQTILQHEIKEDYGIFNGEKLWSQLYTVTYKRDFYVEDSHLQNGSKFSQDSSMIFESAESNLHFSPFLTNIFYSEFASDLDKSSPAHNILILLNSLESMNKFASHLMTHEKIYAFSKGKVKNLDNLKILNSLVPQNEFVSRKLTEKLEQQMCDPLAITVGGMPSWCTQVMSSCPFLFGFEARCKYFKLSAFGPQQGKFDDSNSSSERQLTRKKYLVNRDKIMDSAAKMMDQHARHKVVLEVEYEQEVGTGLGPTLEFYTLVGQEFQKNGLGMWREDLSRFGLFPRPWDSTLSASNEIAISEVVKKFFLLGQIVARAIQDGRVLDVPFSKAFYKLILGQELSFYDIELFDPELGRTLIEFKAIVDRKRYVDSACGLNSTFEQNSYFRNTKIEDLCLDFTLPGYPDYKLTHGPDDNNVCASNLEEYVSLIVDATIHTGILRQVEAFRSGFNQVFPIKHLQIFTEEELERLLCGERDSWDSNELLDHVKFDHGYTVSSPPVLNLLETILDFDLKQRRAFVQFVTGAPRLPPGGLASLSPKLTIVRKQSSKCVDAELPSVMTCANYLKLPPYSSKETMKQKLLYAITEGQGSFHLS